jgi:hypothetical protein
LEGQKLESDKAVEFGVLGFVNHAHTASAKFLDYFVMRDGCADHFTPISFSGVGFFQSMFLHLTV